MYNAASCDTDEQVAVRVLVPDGGELEEPEEEENQSQEEEGAADSAEEGADETEAEEEETEDEEEAESEEEAEEEDEREEAEEEDEREEAEEEDEREEVEAEDGTRILHLNLDGLFLDLLGLEVDLDEVTLDLTARTGEGNLLGNLLSAVSGLLDEGGLGSLLGGGGSLLPSLPDLPNPMDRAREMASALADRIREMIGEAIAALPLEDLLRQFLEGLVDQLLNAGNGDGNGEDASSA